jgi:hypothetical protein
MMPFFSKCAAVPAEAEATELNLVESGTFVDSSPNSGLPEDAADARPSISP